MKSIQKRLLTYLLIGLPMLWLITSSITTWRLWHEIDEMNDTQIVQLARYIIETQRDIDLEGEYDLKQAATLNQTSEALNTADTDKEQTQSEYSEHKRDKEEDKDKHHDDDEHDHKKKKHHDEDDSKFAKIYTLNNTPLSIEIEGNLGNAKDDYIGFAIWDKSGRLLMADHNGQSFEFLADQQGFLEEHQHTYQRLNLFSKDWRLFYVHDDYANNKAGRVIAVGQNLKSRRELIINAITVQLLPVLLGLLTFIGLVIWAVRQGFAPLRQISDELSARDLSDNRPIQADTPKEVQTLVNALNSLFIKVAEALEREQRFTADASHELRSPLTAIKLQIDLLKQQLLQYPNNENEAQIFYHVQKISDGIDRANHLVEQLLTLAKLAPQQQLPEDQLQPADWIALTDEVLAEVNRSAREKFIQLKRHINSPDIHLILPIDINPTLFKIMLRNLLDNAIRYCPEHSTVEIQLNPDSIVIRDNGLGVTPENLTKISERFYRPAGQSQLGSGLGLSIVHQIAALHQLSVHFANRPAPESGLVVTLKKTVTSKK